MRGVFDLPTQYTIMIKKYDVHNDCLACHSDGADMVPAFIHNYDHRKGRTVGTLKAQPTLYRLMKKLVSKDKSSSFRIPALELPMMVPPRPWTSVTEGGYLVSPG